MSAFSWRCQYCGWSFQLTSDVVAAALATAEANHARHHVEHCPRCRKGLKIPLDQLRRHVPASGAAAAPAPGSEPTPKEDLKPMSDKPAPYPPAGGSQWPPPSPTFPPIAPISPPAAPMPTSMPPVSTPAPAPAKPAVKRPRRKPAAKRPAAKKPVAKKKVAKKTAKRKPVKKSVKKTTKRKTGRK
jgi:hypothetical protein